MSKKLVISIVIVVLTLASVSTVSAKPNLAFLIQDLSYSVTTVGQRLSDNGKLNLGLIATGAGTIECQGNAACAAAGLDGVTLGFQQRFGLVLSFMPGQDSTRGEFKGVTDGEIIAFTPGQDSTLGEFKGRVRGLGDCNCGVCDVSMSIRANANNGVKLTFDLVGVLRDDSNLGPVFDSLAGEFGYN